MIKIQNVITLGRFTPVPVYEYLVVFNSNCIRR